jgi:RNA-directed DNA polymerase
MADAFLAGEWDPPAMTRRGQRAVGQRRVWVRDLALAARHAYPRAPLDAPRELTRFLAECPPLRHAFATALERSQPAPTIRRWFLARTAMGPARWPVTPLHSLRDLQDLFGLPLGKLLWLADPRQLERTVAEERLRHYHYRWTAKTSGGFRLIEEPKPFLKHLQRVLVREVLNHIPAHDAAHGFRPGRSAITYAASHAGHAIVIHLDLEDFFGTVTAGRIFGILRTCGYPEPVAHLLAALTTNSIPPSVWAALPRPTSSLFHDARVVSVNTSAIPICPKALRPRPPWPTCPHTTLTSDRPVWPNRPESSTAATPMTWPCRRRSLSGAPKWHDWSISWNASPERKVSGSTRSRPSSRDPPSVNAWPGWSSTNAPTLTDASTTR